ncbi:MAG: peptidoglycan recognition protein family protein [Anaerohalosphaeraceae bacterium]|nr:peptidoglycan recognition protein family protein [Anaerohalosphaeraceae bacterium]
MIKKIIVFVLLAYIPSLLVLFVGCAEEESYMPEISGVVTNLHYTADYTSTAYVPAKKTYSPPAKKKYKKVTTVRKDYYAEPKWTPPKGSEKGWNAIVIHHSATQRGSMATFDDYHRNVNGWEGVGYNFVVGNGYGSGNGEVETTFRWSQQRVGAHCKTDYTNWANKNAIGICLVGNFEQSRPSYRQMFSVSKLVKFLSSRYNIPASRIYGHKDTPRHSTSTNCPGRYFPMVALKSKL